MTKQGSSACIALGMLMGLLLAASPAIADGAGTNAFAKRAAGAYLLESDFLGIQLRSLTTIDSEGSLSGEDTSDYGALGPEFPRFQSDQRGSWKQSGRFEAMFLSIGFDFDDEGHDISILRLRGQMRFDRDFGGYEVVDGLVEVFFDPTADPLDPETVPDLTLPWTGMARRISATLD